MRPSRHFNRDAWKLHEKFSRQKLGDSCRLISDVSSKPCLSQAADEAILQQLSSQGPGMERSSCPGLEKKHHYLQPGEAATGAVKMTVPSLPRVSAEKWPQRLCELSPLVCLVLVHPCSICSITCHSFLGEEERALHINSSILSARFASSSPVFWGLKACEPGANSGPKPSQLPTTRPSRPRSWRS